MPRRRGGDVRKVWLPWPFGRDDILLRRVAEFLDLDGDSARGRTVSISRLAMMTGPDCGMIPGEVWP